MQSSFIAEPLLTVQAFFHFRSKFVEYGNLLSVKICWVWKFFFFLFFFLIKNDFALIITEISTWDSRTMYMLCVYYKNVDSFFDTTRNYKPKFSFWMTFIDIDFEKHSLTNIYIIITRQENSKRATVNHKSTAYIHNK